MIAPVGLTRLATSANYVSAGYGVVIEIEEEIDELIQWCEDNISSQSWKLDAIGEAPFKLAKFWFDEDVDAVLIRLRWPGCSIQEYDRAGCPII